MVKQITKYLIIALILSLGFGQLLRFELFSVPIYLHDVFVVLALALLVPNFVMKYKVRNFVSPIWLMLFLFALAISSLRALTIYPLSSLLIPSLYMLRLLVYLLLFFVIRQSKVQLPLKYFYISALVSLCIGLLQYFLMPDMRWAQYLGWDDHLSRLTLPHFDPTFTAVMFGLALLTIQLKSWYVTFLLSLSILLTYSRSVWLSLVVTAMLFIKNKKVLLLSSILVLVSIYMLPQKFGEGTNLLRTYSISSRFSTDIAYIQKYKWDFLIGRGMNTLILDLNCDNPACAGRHATGPNNSYLYVLSTTGILGLVGWGVFMFTLYKKSIYKPMLVFFFVSSIFNNVMFYPFALLWVLITEAMAPTST